MAPEARQVTVSAHGYDNAGKPDCAWDGQAARDALVTALATDALAAAGLDDGSGCTPAALRPSARSCRSGA
ncbi:MAG: hypothetical protein ACRDYX_21795 [Egibacteraceae bacterium]